ncbi:MurR/RpiR family transcriptional regulator, partial [Alcaligenes pakistanensis]
MSETAVKSFVGRLREILHDLSPSERRLAEFALDFPGDLAGYSASELASLAHVSNATVTRFIRRLGYSNYEAARKQVRSEKKAGSPLLLAATET